MIGPRVPGDRRGPYSVRSPAGVPLLVLRALGLGDMLTAVPALRGLRRAFPGSAITLAGPAGPGEWLRGQGLVDAVLPTEGVVALPDRLADRGPAGAIAVNLHGSGPDSHLLLAQTHPSRLIAFAGPGADHRGAPPWRADEHEVDRWCRLVRSAGGPCDPEDLRLEPPRTPGPRAEVVLHPGAASPARRWPVARWRAVLAELVAQGRDVAVTGGLPERDLAREVVRGFPVRDLAGRLRLDALAALVAGADLLLSGDTGVAHLATAYGTPSVTLFGPVSPSLWGPRIDAERHTVLWPGTGRRPGDPHASELDPTLARITVPDVLAAAAALPRTAASPVHRNASSGP